MLKSKFVFLVSRATRRLKPSLLLSKKRLLSQSLVDAQKMQSEVIPVAPITIAEHDLGFDLSTSSDTPNQTLDENQHRNGSILLGELPSDVILEVFLRLECLDVLSLSQVCSHQCLMHLLFFEKKTYGDTPGLTIGFSSILQSLVDPRCMAKSCLQAHVPLPTHFIVQPTLD